MEEPIVLDEQNRCIRQDGTVGTLTTDGSSPKHNNRIIEPMTTRGSDIASTLRASMHKQGERNLIENIKNGRGYEGVIEPNLKTKMCNQLLEQRLVEEGDVIRHSYTNSRMNGEMKDIKQKDMSPTIDTRADCLGVVKDYRIRKLTPKECFRLMGVKDEDFEKVEKNQSNSSLYHLAGDSIVVNVLMALFNQML